MAKGEIRNWDKDDGLETVSVRAVAECDGGVICAAGAGDGIALIDDELNLSVLRDERIDGQRITDLRRCGDGRVCGLTSGGDVFTIRDGRLDTFLGHETCGIEGIHSILPDPEHPGRIYLGTTGSEVYYAETGNGFSILRVRKIAPLSSAKSLESINGHIWVCAENGIGALDTDGFHLLKGVPMNTALEQMMTDFEGNLWFVSSRQGVMKIVPDPFSDLFERYDLPEAVTNSTCMLGRQLFIGTDTGLIVLEDGKKAESVPLEKAVTASGKDLGT
jgi:energy-coupling factor transport system substrate-specific component